MEVEQTETVAEAEAPEVAAETAEERDQAQINEWRDDKIGPVETEDVEPEPDPEPAAAETGTEAETVEPEVLSNPVPTLFMPIASPTLKCLATAAGTVNEVVAPAEARYAPPANSSSFISLMWSN